MRILTLYALLFCTLSKLVLRGVFPSLILVSLEGLEFLVGIVKSTNLRSLRDFGINSGLTLVAHLKSGVLFQIKRNAKRRFKYEVRNLSVGVNIFVTILAMLSLIQDTRISGRKLESSLGPLEGQDLMCLLLMVYPLDISHAFLPNSKTSLVLITSLNLDPSFWITLAPLSVALIFPV